MRTGLAAQDMLVHCVFERCAVAERITRHIWPPPAPHERAATMHDVCAENVRLRRKSDNNIKQFTCFCVSMQLKNTRLQIEGVMSRRVCRLSAKHVHGVVKKRLVKEQRHERALHCTCNMRILWCLFGR